MIPRRKRTSRRQESHQWETKTYEDGTAVTWCPRCRCIRTFKGGPRSCVPPVKPDFQRCPAVNGDTQCTRFRRHRGPHQDDLGVSWGRT